MQLMGVNQNCTFIINLDFVCIENMKADDLGSWKSTGTRRAYFKLNQEEKIEFRRTLPSQTTGYFMMVRRYFVHSTYSKFCRCIVEIRGE